MTALRWEVWLEAITRVGNLADEYDVRHVLVAGDVYDHATPSPHTRHQVVEWMRAHASVHWHLLPGNHDSYQPNGLWDQLRRRGLPDNIHAYTEPRAAIIEQDIAVLLPAPLRHRRTLSAPTAWMEDRDSGPGLIRIGLAHGAVYGFDTDEDQRANPIDPERPQLARLDYLALGGLARRAWRKRVLLVQRHTGDGFVSDARYGYSSPGSNRRELYRQLNGSKIPFQYMLSGKIEA